MWKTTILEVHTAENDHNDGIFVDMRSLLCVPFINSAEKFLLSWGYVSFSSRVDCFVDKGDLLKKEKWGSFYDRAFLPAFLVGIGTSSSAATMPVTMQCGEDYGCASSVVRFVVPMGTNINRDGAALYEAVSVIFITQARNLIVYTSMSSSLTSIQARLNAT